MDPLTTASLAGTAISALGGLFRKKSGPAPYSTQIGQAAGNLNRIGSGYQGFADQARQTAGMYRPLQQRSIADLADYLGRGTTDTQRSAYINGITGNVQRSYNDGMANLQARAAAEGGDSSLLAGQRAVLEGMRAQSLGGAANQANDFFNQQRLQNLNALTALYGGATNEADQQYLTGLQGQSGIQNDLFSLYNNLAQQERARQAAAQQAQMQGLSGVAGTLGNLYALSRTGGAPSPLNRTLKVAPGQYDIRG